MKEKLSKSTAELLARREVLRPDLSVLHLNVIAMPKIEATLKLPHDGRGNNNKHARSKAVKNS